MYWEYTEKNHVLKYMRIKMPVLLNDITIGVFDGASPG
jgi:hypothetical protein